MAIHKLTDAKIRNAGPGTYLDGGGLELEVKDTGSASWKFRFTFDGQRTRTGLGPYPAVTLALARTGAEECRRLVAQGIDPRKAQVEKRAETFAEATDKLFELKQTKLKRGGEAGRWMSTLTHHVLPTLGPKAVADVTLEDVVAVLKPIWERDIGRKALNKIAQVMDNARGRDARVLADVETLAKAQLPQLKRKNTPHPSLAWGDVPALWVALGDSVAHWGLKFYLLNIPRVQNVTRAVWAEIDRKAGIWDIPPERMKTDQPFAAPLTRQSVELLRRVKAKFGADGIDFIFPSPSARKAGVISENTWNKWLKDNGWKAADGRIAVAHGFRATFGTWCGDNDICDSKMAARCIQHKVERPEDAVYLRSKLLPQRLAVMQQWADFVTSGERKAAEAAKRRRELDRPVERRGRTLREVLEWSRDDGPDDGPDMTEAEAAAWARSDGLEGLEGEE